MQTIPISSLSPNAFNSEIYDEITPESVKELADSIMNTGLVEPIEISPSHHIISGHRRVAAYKLLGIERIPYKIKQFNTQDEEREYLIAKNQYRVKTNEERLREAKHLQILYSTLGRGGRVNDAAAAAVGMSRRTMENGIAAIDAMDELKETDPEAAAKIRAELGQSISAGYESAKEHFAKKLDTVVDEEIKSAEEDAAREEEARKYFYVPVLSSAISILKNAHSKIESRKDGTFPLALGIFSQDILKMAKRLETWLPENMKACPTCNGTKATPDGNQCPNCLNGKVGLHS